MSPPASATSATAKGVTVNERLVEGLAAGRVALNEISAEARAVRRRRARNPRPLHQVALRRGADRPVALAARRRARAGSPAAGAKRAMASASLRSKVYRQLEPSAWPGKGLSPANLFLVDPDRRHRRRRDRSRPSRWSSRGANWLFDRMEVVVGGIFLVEYLLRLWIAAENPHFAKSRFPRLRYALIADRDHRPGRDPARPVRVRRRADADASLLPGAADASAGQARPHLAGLGPDPRCACTSGATSSR